MRGSLLTGRGIVARPGPATLCWVVHTASEQLCQGCLTLFATTAGSGAAAAGRFLSILHLQRRRNGTLATRPQVICDAVCLDGVEPFVVQQCVAVAGGGGILQSPGGVCTRRQTTATWLRWHAASGSTSTQTLKMMKSPRMVGSAPAGTLPAHPRLLPPQCAGCGPAQSRTAQTARWPAGGSEQPATAGEWGGVIFREGVQGHATATPCYACGRTADRASQVPLPCTPVRRAPSKVIVPPSKVIMPAAILCAAPFQRSPGSRGWPGAWTAQTRAPPQSCCATGCRRAGRRRASAPLPHRVPPPACRRERARQGRVEAAAAGGQLGMTWASCR